MNLEDKISNIINEKPSLIRRGINFLGRKALPIVLSAAIGIGSTYALTSCGKSKKYSGPATEFVDIDESKITQDPDTGVYLVKNQLLLSFNDGVTDAEKQEIINNINGNVVAIDNDLGIYQVDTTVTDLNELYSKADTLELDSRVKFTSLNYALEQTVTKYPDAGKDPIFNIGGGQWDESNPVGLNWAWEYIKTPSAWGKTTGNSNTKIAIIDFGFDINHEDIKNNIAHAEGVLWDLNPDNSHGTEVAGIIGAEGNNNYGITGMNWETDLYLYRASESKVYNTIFGSSVAKYLKKAANSGIKIVNISGAIDWGLESYNPTDPNLPSDSNPKNLKTLDDITQYYREVLKMLKDKGVLLIQSAGNDGIDAKWSGIITPTLASEFPDNFILVAANNDTGNITSFSNYGSLITVSAPGVDITSCTTEEDGWYKSSLTGTSFSAPFVTGLAGLLLSVNPNLTPSQIKQAIVNGAQTGEKFFTKEGNDIYIINSLESILKVINLSSNISNTADLSFDPVIAVDSLNNLHVIWKEVPSLITSSTTYEIFYSRNNGFWWSLPYNITNSLIRNGGNPVYLYYPHLAIDNNDNIHIIWWENNAPSTYKILYSKYDGISWSSPQIISNTDYIEGHNDIVVDSNNNLHVVWIEDYSIFYSKFNGNNWTSPNNIYSTSHILDNIGLAIDSNNVLHVVWGDDHHISYSKYGGAGLLSPQNISGGDSPSITVDSLNNLHVVGYTGDALGNITYTKYNGTMWSTPINIYDGYGPLIRTDNLNNLYVTWGDGTSPNKDIFYSKYDGSNWLSPVNVSNTSEWSSMHQIVVDSNNNLHVVWRDDKLGNPEIFYKKIQQ